MTSYQAQVLVMAIKVSRKQGKGHALSCWKVSKIVRKAHDKTRNRKQNMTS
jgi:hypothetical protein